MFYLGPYEWRDTGGTMGWVAPQGATPVVDLRSLPMQAAAGGTAQGFGIFVGPAGLGAEYIPLGEDINATLPGALRDAWGQRLGFSSLMEARTISEAIWEALTFRADPLGQANAKPLMPDYKGNLVLHHAGSARRVKFTPTRREFPAIQTVLREDYRRIRQAALDGKAPADLHRKVLGAWALKYGITDERVFIPVGLPLERRKAPTTTITESFNKADGDDLGPDLTWTDIAGNPKIVNNAAVPASVGSLESRAESDLSSDDHYAQVVLITATTGNGAGCLIRKDSTATVTEYFARRGSGSILCGKMIDGAFTSLASPAAGAFSSPETFKLEADGSTIKTYLNGAETSSSTDTAVTGNLRTGIHINGDANGPPHIDSFEAADLHAEGGAGYRRLGLHLDGLGL
jgi:hypothetical protein